MNLFAAFLALGIALTTISSCIAMAYPLIEERGGPSTKKVLTYSAIGILTGAFIVGLTANGATG